MQEHVAKVLLLRALGVHHRGMVWYLFSAQGEAYPLGTLAAAPGRWTLQKRGPQFIFAEAQGVDGGDGGNGEVESGRRNSAKCYYYDTRSGIVVRVKLLGVG